MRLKSIINGLILTLAAGILLSYAVTGGSPWFDGESMAYLIMLTGILSGSVAFANRITLPLVVVLVIYTVQRYLLSGYVMLFLSDLGSSPDFARYTQFTVAEYNFSLRFTVLSYLAVALGLIAGVGKVPSRVKCEPSDRWLRDRSTTRISGLVLLAYVLVIGAIQLSAAFVLGESALGIRPEGEGSWLRIFSSLMIPMILVLSVLFFRSRHLRPRDRACLYIGLAALFGAMTLLGSRSFIYSALLNFVLIFAVVRYGNFVVRRVPKAVVILAVIALLTYPVATVFRYRALFEDVPASEAVAESFEFLYGAGGSLSNTVLYSTLARLNSFENSLRIMGGRNVLPVEDFLTLPQIAGRIVNNLVPGDLFPLVAPQYLFDRIYYDRFVGWNAHDWGLWEEFYLIFGILGAPPMLFSFMAVSGFAWRRIIVANASYKLFYIGTFVYTFLQRILVNYEVSLVLSSVAVQLIAFHALMPLLHLSTRALGLRPMEPEQPGARPYTTSAIEDDV